MESGDEARTSPVLDTISWLFCSSAKQPTGDVHTSIHVLNQVCDIHTHRFHFMHSTVVIQLLCCESKYE